MPLTDEQKRQLAELEALRDAPPESSSRGGEVNVFVDLSDPAAVKRALRLGVIERGDLDEFDNDAGDDDGDEGDDDEDDSDDSKRKRKPAAAPRRRLTMADRMMGADAE